jgi:hypothetical protein
MKKNGFPPMMLIAALALTACVGRVSAASPSAEEILSQVNTAVALTKTSQPGATATVTALPVNTPTATPTGIVTPFSKSLANPSEGRLEVSPTPTADSSRYGASGPNTGVTTLCGSSAYLDDMNIPDGTIFAPGETFTKTWKIKNTGTCIWNKFYSVAFSSGDNMSGVTTTLRHPVLSGGVGNVSVKLVAPGEVGTYTGYWIMTDSNGIPFGNTFYVRIVVAVTETPEE